MKVFSASKVLAALPDPLAADTMYCVRVGAGFDLYVTDSTGLIAYKINMPVLTGASGIAVVDALPASPDPDIAYLVFPA